MRLIFLSHSTSNGKLAAEIQKQLLATTTGVEVFLSSRPDSIRSGQPWFESILEKLKSADLLLILITEQATNSTFVGFELGYFWYRWSGKKIHAMHHPRAPLHSPLNHLQVKNVTDLDAVQVAFEDIYNDLGLSFKDITDLSAIITEAKNLKSPPNDRTWGKLLLLLEDAANWEKALKQKDDSDVWTSTEDGIYRIVVDWNDKQVVNIEENTWCKSFYFRESDPPVKLNVYLEINGVRYKEVTFVLLDGERYFVPHPYIDTSGQSNLSDDFDFHEYPSPDQWIYYWEKSSVAFKVGQVIADFQGRGQFESITTLEEFAHKSGIEIRA